MAENQSKLSRSGNQDGWSTHKTRPVSAVRVDILPREVTNELAGLLDEIPAEPSVTIISQIEEDFNRPIGELFEWFSPVPLGAASLGQVHPARLAKDHTEVVVNGTATRH